jgi:hypothetical protein
VQAMPAVLLNLPGEHSEHTLLPTALFRPAGHLWQELMNVALPNLPAWHTRQRASELRERCMNRPSSQGWQDVSPVRGCTEPGSQGVHASTPSSSPNSPAGHPRHAVAPISLLKEPAWHSWHTVWPEIAEKTPLPQSSAVCGGNGESHENSGKKTNEHSTNRHF